MAQDVCSSVHDQEGWLGRLGHVHCHSKKEWGKIVEEQTLTKSKFLTIITNAFLIQAYYLGLGRHIFYVPPEQRPETFRFLWMAEPTNLFALYTVRVSISLSFLRIVPNTRKAFRRLIWATIISLTLSDSKQLDHRETLYINVFSLTLSSLRDCHLLRRVHPHTKGMATRYSWMVYIKCSLPSRSLDLSR